VLAAVEHVDERLARLKTVVLSLVQDAGDSTHGELRSDAFSWGHRE
jgi:hypothetical protein